MLDSTEDGEIAVSVITLLELAHGTTLDATRESCNLYLWDGVDVMHSVPLAVCEHMSSQFEL